MDEFTITLKAENDEERTMLKWLREIGDNSKEIILTGVSRNEGFQSFKRQEFARKENERIASSK